MATNSAIIARRNPGRRELRRLFLTGAFVLAALGLGAGNANANANATNDARFTAKVVHRTLVVDATSADDRIALRLKAGDPETLQVDHDDDGVAEFSFHRSRFSEIDVEAGAGEDEIRIDEANGVFTDTELTTLRGEGGDDRIVGGSGSERIRSGHGDDFVDGNGGDDDARLSAGYDFFAWEPGDGSDRIDGADDRDIMVLKGSNDAEVFRVFPDGDRATLGRTNLSGNAGDILMETESVEIFVIDALGGVDNVQLEDMAGTALDHLEVDLAGAPHSPLAEGFADRVLVKGTEADDEVEIVGGGGIAAVLGLSTVVRVSAAEALDNVVVATQDGQDSITAAALGASAFALTMDGGEGSDTIHGGANDELLLGGPANDFIDGGRGDDQAQLGQAHDTFRWDPGDGSDQIDGALGSDTMLFNGAGVAENFDVSANGPRVRFFRDVADITMDLRNTERIELNPLGGADNVVVGDLSGTDLDVVDVDLASVVDGFVPDGQPDTVTVNGTDGDDAITVSGASGSVNVAGLTAAAGLANADAALDSLVINTLAGIDAVDSSGLAANTIQLAVN